MTPDNSANIQTATLGGGCFWCLEAIYLQMKGVTSVKSGYSGGHVDNPTYEQVCGKKTGHAEVVQLEFDPTEVSYRDILDIFFTIHDPTTPDRQGGDIGPQYRSVIFTHSPQQGDTARESIAAAQDNWDDPIVTEIVPLERFWPAETSHDDYFSRNPQNPYCAAVVAPKVTKARKELMSRMLVK